MFEFVAIKQALSGKMSWGDALGIYADIILRKMNIHTYGDRNKADIMRRKKAFYLKDGKYYRFRDIKLPLLDEIDEMLLFTGVCDDTFFSYLYCGDDYSEKTFDKCDVLLPEGLYGLVNDKVNVTVKPGDIVIDAGSWIGDFAAYASISGGG